MSTAFDPEDPREAAIRRRLAAFRQMRPIRLRDRGFLAEQVAEWGSRLFDKTAGNLVIVGGTGTTKTWQVWEVLERAIAHGYAGSIMFVTAAEWQDIVGPPADRARLREMRFPGVLVIDDMDSVGINNWTRRLLSPLVDWRWQHDLPIVLTTNLEEDQDLDDLLGERIASRLADGCTVVALDGDDLRAAR